MYKILIVDDEKWIRKGIIAKLRHPGFEFSWIGESENGAEAVELIREQTPQIVITDVRMPVMDGIEFLKKLKPKENLPEAKIIVFSNYDDQHEIDQAFSLGAMHYMLKAWATPDELVKLIREVDNASQPVA